MARKTSSMKKSLVPKRVIGIIHSGTASNADHKDPINAFKAALANAGFDSANTTILGPDYAGNDFSLLDRLAQDMVTKSVEVLVAAGGTRSAEAAELATGTSKTPVVFTTVREVNTYPSHMTGVCALTSALDTDRLELLSMLLVPPQTQIGVLTNSNRKTFATEWSKLQSKANQLGVVLVQKDIPSTLPDNQIKLELRLAFQALATIPTLVMADPFFNDHRRKVVAAAAQFKVPVMYQWREFVNAGGLMSYGTKLQKAYRVAGSFTGTVLRTGRIPRIRQLAPELVISLGAATNLGITIPEELLVLADETPSRLTKKRISSARKKGSKSKVKPKKPKKKR